MAEKNGLNMLDVKKRNRKMILELIYRSEKIPRKEIAKALELTPAAITLITTDLIQEGILVESSKRESSSRGRREVLLEINSKKFVSAGICITRNHVKLICIDLSAKILFQKKFRTTEFHRDPEQILAFAAKQLEALLSGTSILKKRTLVGIGISTLGIVNSNSGESINSYGVFDKRIKISPYFENRFHVPVYLVNNICACAHGEAFLSNSPLQSGRLLFIKYGPGVGSALLASDDYFNVDEYSAIQMAHVIMDPHGKPCICGNQGCLETLVSYDSIIQDLSDIFPSISELIDCDTPEAIMENKIIPAYNQGNKPITLEINRVIYYLSTAIKNAITMLDPESVVLYGELFKSRKFRYSLMEILNAYTKTQIVSFSNYNMQLEDIGPATMAISRFFMSGGVLPSTPYIPSAVPSSLETAGLR